MSKEEITELLEKFYAYLSISNPITDVFRYLGWAIIRGLAFFTDSLEGITDNILLLKYFYQNEDIANFVETLRPFFYILLALSIAYAGFLLIFQKKFDREGMIVNIFIACTVVILLSAGMDKAGEFTDAAVEVMKVGDLANGEEDAKLSDSIIKQGVTDLMMFDKNEWTTTELEDNNTVPVNKIKLINPKERFTEKDTELKLSKTSKEISMHLLTGAVEGFTATKLDQSGLKYNNEYYFRYSIQWFHILVALGVISFTLLSISIKLAKLFFELAFNYVLATVIAPSDVYDGQKTKKVIQSILNIFIVTILIFMSIKIYIIGVGFLESNTSGLTYLIALLAFSWGVLDAPNIIERLYGIDGGLKSGWGILTGAYVGSRIIANATKSIGNIAGRSERAADDYNQSYSESKNNNPKHGDNNYSNPESKNNSIPRSSKQQNDSSYAMPEEGRTYNTSSDNADKNKDEKGNGNL